MKNWKTTLGGVIAALGLFLIAQPNPLEHLAGEILAPLGAFLTGLAATDGTPAAPPAA